MKYLYLAIIFFVCSAKAEPLVVPYLETEILKVRLGIEKGPAESISIIEEIKNVSNHAVYLSGYIVGVSSPITPRFLFDGENPADLRADMIRDAGVEKDKGGVEIKLQPKSKIYIRNPVTRFYKLEKGETYNVRMEISYSTKHNNIYAQGTISFGFRYCDKQSEPFEIQWIDSRLEDIWYERTRADGAIEMLDSRGKTIDVFEGE